MLQAFCFRHLSGYQKCFNPSNGRMVIATEKRFLRDQIATLFQSLTGDASNLPHTSDAHSEADRGMDGMHIGTTGTIASCAAQCKQGRE